MALLTITALDVSAQPDPGLTCVARLCDNQFNVLRAFGPGGLLVESAVAQTNSSGVAIIDLVPNSQVMQSNTYYAVKVGNTKPVLIEKGTGPETLEEAAVLSPLSLGPAAVFNDLADVDLSGLADLNTVRYSGGKWVPWAWPTGGSGQLPWSTISSNTTLLASQATSRYKVDASAGAISLVLPTAVGNMGLDFVFKRVNPGNNLVTIVCQGVETIDGSFTYVMREQWEAITVSSDGTNWMVM